MTFLPDNYNLPVSSNYMKFLAGENTFRIFSEATTGWIYWTADKKPVRSKLFPKETPDIKLNEKGDPTPIKHFWIIIVWNYKDKRVQLLEITQATIMAGMMTPIESDKWGDPKEYDFVVTRTGENMETKYSVIPNPKHGLALDEKEQTKVKALAENLDKIFEGGDPFEGLK